MEGPSLHLVAQELQIFVNQKIKKAEGNAQFAKDDLPKQTINHIYAYGKNLIIQCDTVALVTHFLMYGSYRVDEKRPGMQPRLALITPKHQLYLYNCSIKRFQTANYKKTLDLDLDILSPDWNIKKIITLVKKQSGHTIDDVLLDQNIFPGVGNIIKNEALFLSKILPTKKISDLSAAQLKKVIQNTREFSLNFFKWRKVFELKKHLLIYRKSLCPQCGTKVVRQKTGKKQRWSFFCIKCQK